MNNYTNKIKCTLAILQIIFWVTVIFSLFIKLGFTEEYTKEEIEIAKVISSEACGEGYKGMYAIANVIKNRSIKYNITPYQVVTQKNQFYGYTAKNKESLFYQSHKISLCLAKNIMNLKDITKKALYFKTRKEKKRKWHKIKTVTIKNHEFWK